MKDTKCILHLIDEVRHYKINGSKFNLTTRSRKRVKSG